MRNSFSIGNISVSPGTKFKGLLEVSCRNDGISPIGIPMIVANGSRDGPVLCVDAGIHGDELEPPEAIGRIGRQLDPSKLNGVFIGIPVLNVLAYEAASRTIPKCYERDQNDMNRQIPGDPRGFLTQRILHKFLSEIVPKAEYNVTCHGGSEAIMHVAYAGWYEGPIVPKDLAGKCRTLAEAFGTDYLLIDYVASDTKASDVIGTLSRYYNSIGRTSIFAEVGIGHDRYLNREKYVSILEKGILNVMKHLKMIEGEPELPKRQILLGGKREEGYGYATANKGGMCVLRKRAGDSVLKGDLIATIMNVFGDPVEDVFSPNDGFICQTRGTPVISCGGWVFSLKKVIGEQTPRLA